MFTLENIIFYSLTASSLLLIAFNTTMQTEKTILIKGKILGMEGKFKGKPQFPGWLILPSISFFAICWLLAMINTYVENSSLLVIIQFLLLVATVFGALGLLVHLALFYLLRTLGWAIKEKK